MFLSSLVGIVLVGIVRPVMCLSYSPQAIPQFRDLAADGAISWRPLAFWLATITVATFHPIRLHVSARHQGPQLREIALHLFAISVCILSLLGADRF
jgi:hypothetical protein